MVNLNRSILTYVISDIKPKRTLMGKVIVYTDLEMPLWLYTARIVEEISPKLLT